MKILNRPFSYCHEQVEKLLEGLSRIGIGAQHTQGKREYFVHECMKILAKRKRGNKFPLRGKQGRRPKESREKQIKEETNPRTYLLSLGRVTL